MVVSPAADLARGRLKLWLPVIAVMGAIFYASCLPGTAIPSLFVHQDILFHGSIYAILALFFYRALKFSRPAIGLPAVFAITVVFCSVYGASDEFHQMFTPGRDCSGFDLMVDTGGASIGALLGGLFLKWLK